MKTIMVKIPETDEVQYEIECLSEDMPVQGNVIMSGDPEYDKQVEDKIIEESEWNQWIWCCVRVVARWKGLKGDDYLGACSYKDEEDYKKSGYYEQMKDAAYKDLIQQIEELSNINEKKIEEDGQ